MATELVAVWSMSCLQPRGSNVHNHHLTETSARDDQDGVKMTVSDARDGEDPA